MYKQPMVIMVVGRGRGGDTPVQMERTWATQFFLRWSFPRARRKGLRSTKFGSGALHDRLQVIEEHLIFVTHKDRPLQFALP